MKKFAMIAGVKNLMYSWLLFNTQLSLFRWQEIALTNLFSPLVWYSDTGESVEHETN
jgi:hypothetical protein